MNLFECVQCWVAEGVSLWRAFGPFELGSNKSSSARCARWKGSTCCHCNWQRLGSGQGGGGRARATSQVSEAINLKPRTMTAVATYGGQIRAIKSVAEPTPPVRRSCGRVSARVLGQEGRRVNLFALAAPVACARVQDPISGDHHLCRRRRRRHCNSRTRALWLRARAR